MDHNDIGETISTKKVGVAEREIVTDNYKAEEGIFSVFGF